MDGRKFDTDKVDMTILPAPFLVETARALSHGAEKYDRWNYLKVEDGGRRYAAAMLRHITAWMGGEDTDPDSGLHHLACASSNLAMLVSLKEHGTDIGYWRERVNHDPAPAAPEVPEPTPDLPPQRFDANVNRSTASTGYRTHYHYGKGHV